MKAHRHPNGPDEIEVPHARCKCGGRFTYCRIIDDPTSASCERCHSNISVDHINENSVATDLRELERFFIKERLFKTLRNPICAKNFHAGYNYASNKLKKP